MKLTFKKALNIAQEERIKDFSILIKRVKEITETKYNYERIENKLLDLIFDNREISLSCYDNQTLIYRADIANRRVFYINLTAEEIKDKKLYLGHRFFPFINPVKPMSQLNIIDKDKNKIILSKTKVSHEKAYKYIIFQVMELLEMGNPTDDHLELDSIDLNSIISGKEKNFSFKVTIEDYDKKLIVLEPLSAKEHAENALLCRNGDRLLHEEIKRVLSSTSEIYGFDEILQTVLSECSLEKMPRFNSIANVINSQTEFGVENVYGLTTIKLVEELEKRQLKSNPNVTPGLAKNLDGILNEMGLTLTEDFIYSLMFEMIQKDEFDFQWLLMELMEIEVRISNDKQFDNLQKAFTDLANRILRDVKLSKVSALDLKSLAKYNDATLQIIFFLRDVDVKFGDSKDFDVNQLVPLLEIDKLIEEIYSNFRHKKKFTIDERKGAKDVYDGVVMVIESLKERLF